VLARFSGSVSWLFVVRESEFVGKFLNELSESGSIAALTGTPQKSLRMAGLSFHADQLGVSFS
jgi:hypothetical protein